VQAEQISLLMSKPLGVQSVINPLRASGGADRESGDTACKNAAITAVNNAAAQGTDVFVIYYGTNSSDANWLQTLPRGNGFYLNAPTADDIVKRMQQVCSSQPHRLVY
jgi:hypothetical protein